MYKQFNLEATLACRYNYSIFTKRIISDHTCLNK